MVSKPGFQFQCHGVSHPGRVRPLNEDRHLMAPRSGLWLVADGMGGHDAGEVASSAIVEHLSTLGVASSAPDLRARFEDRIERANAEIWALSQARGGATIGSTMAALLVFEHQFACFWLGDSRVYLLREGVLSQLSRDHTEVQELIDRGLLTPQEAKSWPRRNVVTAAVGVSRDIAVDMELGQIRPGDVFILNTDGLTAHVGDAEIREAVLDNDPESACAVLLQTVLERGGTDNVTIVVVKCLPQPAGEETLLRPPGGGLRHVG